MDDPLDPFPLFHLADLNFEVSESNITSLSSSDLALASLSSDWDERLSKKVTKAWRQKRERSRRDIGLVNMGRFASTEESSKSPWARFELIDLSWPITSEASLERLSSAQLAVVQFHPDSTKDLVLAAEDNFYKRRERDFAKGLTFSSLPTPSPSLAPPSSPGRDSISSAAAPPEMFAFPGLQSPSSNERTTRIPHSLERNTQSKVSTVVSLSLSPTKSIEIRGAANNERSAAGLSILPLKPTHSGELERSSISKVGVSDDRWASTISFPRSGRSHRPRTPTNDEYTSQGSSRNADASGAIRNARITTEAQPRSSRSEEKYVAPEAERDERNSYANNHSSMLEGSSQRSTHQENFRSDLERESSRSQSLRTTESRADMDPFKMAYGAINQDRMETIRVTEEPQGVESIYGRELEDHEGRSRRMGSRFGREREGREDHEESRPGMEAMFGRRQEDYDSTRWGEVRTEKALERGREDREDVTGRFQREESRMNIDRTSSRSLDESSRSRSPRRNPEHLASGLTREFSLADPVPNSVQILFSEVYLHGFNVQISPGEVEEMLRPCCSTPPIGCKIRSSPSIMHCFIAYVSDTDAKRVIAQRLFKYRDNVITALPCRSSVKKESRKPFPYTYIYSYGSRATFIVPLEHWRWSEYAQDVREVYRQEGTTGLVAYKKRLDSGHAQPPRIAASAATTLPLPTLAAKVPLDLEQEYGLRLHSFLNGPPPQIFVSNMPENASIVEMREFFGGLLGAIGMRMGRQNLQFRNRSGWIGFDSIEQRDAAISILRGRIFSPHPIPLYLEKGAEGKKATGWNWEDMSKAFCLEALQTSGKLDSNKKVSTTKTSDPRKSASPRESVEVSATVDAARLGPTFESMYQPPRVASGSPPRTDFLDGMPVGSRNSASFKPDADRPDSPKDSSPLPKSLTPPRRRENLTHPLPSHTNHPGGISKSTAQEAPINPLSESIPTDVRVTASAGYHPFDPPPAAADISKVEVVESKVVPKQTSRLPISPATSPVTSKKRPSVLEMAMDTSGTLPSTETSTASQNNSPSKRMKREKGEAASTDSVLQEKKKYAGSSDAPLSKEPLDLIARISPDGVDSPVADSLFSRVFGS